MGRPMLSLWDRENAHDSDTSYRCPGGTAGGDSRLTGRARGRRRPASTLGPVMGPCAASVGYPRHDRVCAGVAGQPHRLDRVGMVRPGRRSRSGDDALRAAAALAHARPSPSAPSGSRSPHCRVRGRTGSHKHGSRRRGHPCGGRRPGWTGTRGPRPGQPRHHLSGPGRLHHSENLEDLHGAGWRLSVEDRRALLR